MLSITEESLQRKALKKKFNIEVLEITLPVGNTDVSIWKFISDYNSNLESILTVEDEWLQEVRTVMIRIFEKRGIGLTDEQWLMITIGEDIVSKSMGVMTIKSQVNQVLGIANEILKNQREIIRQQSAPPPPKPKEEKQPTITTPRPPKQEKEKEKVEETDITKPADDSFEEPEEAKKPKSKKKNKKK